MSETVDALRAELKKEFRYKATTIPREICDHCVSCFISHAGPISNTLECRHIEKRMAEAGVEVTYGIAIVSPEAVCDLFEDSQTSHD